MGIEYMAHKPLDNVVHRLRQLVGTGPGPHGPDRSDAELLADFVERREEGAFAALLERHGRMVLNVCRRQLHDPHEVDDVFQSTFLVLVRQAGSIRKRDSIASWLYGVACRLAWRVQSDAARRRRHEQQATVMAQPDPQTPLEQGNLRLVLDEELERLPEKYRAPLVLCYLEGKSSEEAAGQLGWPVGTLWGRLSRARDLLRTRLTRRGITLTSTALAAVLAEGTASALPASLTEATLQAALHLAAGQSAAAALLTDRVAALTKGMVDTMFWNQVRRVVVITLLVAVAGAAGSVGLYKALAVPAGPAATKPVAWKLTKPVLAVALSKTGMVAAVTADGQILLYDPATGKQTKRLVRFKDQRKPVVNAKQYFEGPPSYPPCLAFSADGSKLIGIWDLAAGYRARHEWDVATGKELRVTAQDMFGPGYFPTALSPDGKLLATVDFKPGGIRFGGQKPKFPNDYDTVVHVGTIVPYKELRKGGFRVIRPRDANGTFVSMRKELRNLTGHKGPVTAVAFSADGKMLASASEDRTIRFWDVDGGRLVGSQSGLKSSVHSLAFSADGKTILIGSSDGSLRLESVPRK